MAKKDDAPKGAKKKNVDILAKFKALPVKTKNLIFIVLGVAIFIGAYMLGYQKITEQTTAINEKLSVQSAYASELKGYDNNILVYRSGIETAKTEINNNLAHLPFGIKNEDFLMYVKTMNEKVEGDFSSITFDEDSFIGEFGCRVKDQSVTASAMRASATFTTSMNYEQFKNMLQYIYDTDNITFIDNVSVTYNSSGEGRELDVTMALSKYYIEYDGCEYVPVAVPDVPMGTSDPFGG